MKTGQGDVEGFAQPGTEGFVSCTATVAVPHDRSR